MAGPIFRVPMASGEFHDVTSKQRPTGCFIVTIRDLSSGAVDHEPSSRTASLQPTEEVRRVDHFLRDSAIGLPISGVMSSASSTLRCHDLVGAVEDLTTLPWCGRGPARLGSDGRIHRSRGMLASATCTSTSAVLGSSMPRIFPVDKSTY